LMSGAHVRVLCGASLEPRRFVTVDVEVIPGRAPWNGLWVPKTYATSRYS
jgi:hypothetical protein